MTTLAIVANHEKKRLSLTGTVAAGEHVAVTLEDGWAWANAAGAALRLRVVFAGKLIAEFPRRDADPADTWSASGDDATCELNINSVPAAKHLKFGGDCVWVLDDPELNTLYGIGELEVLPWRREPGGDVPYNLDGYPDLLDEFEEVKDAVSEFDTKKINKSAFISLLGKTLPETATQKEVREMVHDILELLKNAAVCAALAFALPAFGIDANTAWEDMPPQTKVKNVVEQFSPPADFSTNNATLVETIEAKSGKVKSVNSKTGDVVLDAADVGALKLGTGGANEAQGFKVRIGTSSVAGVSYMEGRDGGLGVVRYVGGNEMTAMFILPSGVLAIYKNGTLYNQYDPANFIYYSSVVPMTYSNIHSSNPTLVVSPRYVYDYLTNGYETASTADGKYLKQTVAANTYLAKTDAANTYARIEELVAATGSIYRVYGDTGQTNYIDGARGVWAKLSGGIAYSNELSQVFLPVEGENMTWQYVDGTDVYTLVQVNFFWILRKNGVNIARGPKSDDVTIWVAPDGTQEQQYFYRFEILGGWTKIGELALEATVPNNITRTATDATLVHCDNGTCTNAILYIRQATHSLAGLMTAADKADFDALKNSAVTHTELTNTVNAVKELHYDDVLNVTWEMRVVGGEIKFFAVTNANISVLGE